MTFVAASPDEAQGWECVLVSHACICAPRHDRKAHCASGPGCSGTVMSFLHRHNPPSAVGVKLKPCRIDIEYLPAYAPDLSGAIGRSTSYRTAVPRTSPHSDSSAARPCRMRRRSSLFHSFWKQAELSLSWRVPSSRIGSRPFPAGSARLRPLEPEVGEFGSEVDPTIEEVAEAGVVGEGGSDGGQVAFLNEPGAAFAFAGVAQVVVGPVLLGWSGLAAAAG